MEFDLETLKNYYNISFEFKRDYGEDGEKYFSLLKKNFHQEVTERETINSIILDTSKKIGQKIEEILIIQSFSNNYRWFHLEYEELLNILIGFNDDLPPTSGEFERINKLLDLIYLIKNDLITPIGINELYTEFKHLSKEIIGNPLDYYINSFKYFKLNDMAQSSDVISAIKKLKKLSLKSFLSSCKDITYMEFKEMRKSFEFLYKNKYKKELDNFEQTNKFKIDKFLWRKLKRLREVNILSKDSFSSEDLLDLNLTLPPIYWKHIDKFLWKGLKRELFLIKRIKNKERKMQRINVLLYRYPKIHKKLSLYINNNITKL